jgi:hypothetical protein
VRTPPLLERALEGFDFGDLLVGRALEQELRYRSAYRQSFERIC